MLPDSGGSTSKKRTFTGNSFLGVRPGTITKKTPYGQKPTVTKKPVAKRTREQQKAAATFMYRSLTGTTVPLPEIKLETVKQALKPKALPQALHAELSPEEYRTVKTIRDNRNRAAVRSTPELQRAYSYTPHLVGQYGRVGTQARIARDYWLEPQTTREMAEAAAKRDTTTDEVTYNVYNKIALNSTLHEALLDKGKTWMVDEELLLDWITADPNKADERIGEYEAYMERYVQPTEMFDVEQNKLVYADAFVKDAPLPPWIAYTPDNQTTWEYYIAYSAAFNKESALKFREAEALKKLDTELPYRSAFGDDSHANDVVKLVRGGEYQPDINSFLDVAIAGDWYNSYGALTNYMTEYYWNPLKRGKFSTVFGNAVWNMFDLFDYAARGMRAFTAGDLALGGAPQKQFKTHKGYDISLGNKFLGPDERIYTSSEKEVNDSPVFEGQNEYWISNNEEDRKAQTMFLRNGGYELLLRKHPDYQNMQNMSTKYAAMSDDEIRANLDVLFQYSHISWQSIAEAIDANYFGRSTLEDVKSGIENVKKTYSDPNATYEIDTGSFGADMILNIALDPDFLIGGVSKTATKKGIETAAEMSIREGFSAVLNNSDEVLNNKSVRAAINKFLTKTEGKAIIFKDMDSLKKSVDSLIADIRKNTSFLITVEDQNNFRSVVLSHLVGKNMNINSNIVASTDWARKVVDTKAFKSAYYMDKAVDFIDSSLVKASFFAPWATVKGIEKGKNVLYNTDTVTRIRTARRLQKTAAARTVIGDATNEVDIVSLEKLVQKQELGVLREEDVKASLQLIVDTYDDMSDEIRYLSRDFMNQKYTTSKRSEELISTLIAKYTNGKYTDIDSLEAYVKSLDLRYAGNVRDAFGHLKNTYDEFRKIVEYKTKNLTEEFLAKITSAQSSDDVYNLLREYQYNDAVFGLRDEIVDAVSFAGFTVEDVDSMKTIIKEVAAPLTKEEMATTIKAISHASEGTVDRKISKATFMALVEEAGIPLSKSGTDVDVSDPFELFIKNWDDKNAYAKGDVIKFLDKYSRRIHFRWLLDNRHVAATAAIDVSELVANIKHLRDLIKRTDVVSLKDAKVITTLHTDAMALFNLLSSKPEIDHFVNKFFEENIATFVDATKNMSIEEASLVSSSFVTDLRTLEALRYGYMRTQDLRNTIMAIPGFSEARANILMNAISNNFGRFGDLQDLTLSPDSLCQALETTMRAQTGESKLSINSLTDMMKTINSSEPVSFTAKHASEIADNPELAKTYFGILDADPLSFHSYTEKQILGTMMMDQNLDETVRQYNALAEEGKAPIFMHINTTGLNSDIHEISSVSMYRWNPISFSDEDPITLQKIVDNIVTMREQNSTLIKRGLSANDIGAISENVLRRLDRKGRTYNQLLEDYTKVYGVSDDNPLKSEQELLEEVCGFLNANAAVETEQGLKAYVPKLIVHDLDGFNIQYLNRKITQSMYSASADSQMRYYVDRLAYRIDAASINSYHMLSEQVDDIAFTADQIDSIVDILIPYIDDINRRAPEHFRFTDYASYSRTVEHLIRDLSRKEEIEGLSKLEQSFVDSFNNADGSNQLQLFNQALETLSEITIRPRQYAFVSSDTSENVMKTARQALGKDAVSVSSRIYVDDVLAFFDIDLVDNAEVPIDDLIKMHRLAKYVSNIRDTGITSGAEEFLTPLKDHFDELINSIVNISRQNSFDSTELAYLTHIKKPNTAVESYLICQKLFNDHVKYWLSDDLVASFNRSARDLDEFKLNLQKIGFTKGWKSPEYQEEADKVYQRACEFVNNYRKRIMDELATGTGLDPVTAIAYTDFASEIDAVRDAFWDNVSENVSAIWKDTKALMNENRELAREMARDAYNPIKENWRVYNDIKDELFENINSDLEQLSKEWDVLHTYQEYRTYLYQSNKERRDIGWENYRALSDEASALLQNIRETRSRLIHDVRIQYPLISKQDATRLIKPELDGLYAPYFNLKNDLKNMREELSALYSADIEEEHVIKEEMYSFIRDHFPDGKNLSDNDLVAAYKADLRVRKEMIVSSKSDLKLLENDINLQFEEIKGSVDEFFESVSDENELLYEKAKLDSTLYFDDAKMDYNELSMNSLSDLYDKMDEFRSTGLQADNQVLDILEGAHRPEIYKSASKLDYEKRILTYRNGKLSVGIDYAAKYNEVKSALRSDQMQLNSIDLFYRTHGIENRSMLLSGMLHTKAEQLFTILNDTGFAKKESFQTFINKTSELYQLEIQRFRLRDLRINGSFNREKLLSELVFNKANMTVFNSHNYSPEVIRELERFVTDLQSKGDDFLSMFRDESTGNLYIYLNNRCQVAEGGYLLFNGNSLTFNKTVKSAVNFPDFDELMKVLDDPEMEEYRGIYSHLLSCWEDTRMLSRCEINGTTGKLVTRAKAEEFLASIPSEMNDLLSPEGLLFSDISRGAVYDPGFMLNEDSDLLLDFLETFSRQVDLAKDDCVLVNEMFMNDSSLRFSELTEYFSDEELIEYFGENAEFVVVVLTPSEGTKTGLAVTPLRIKSPGDIRVAKGLDNTTILPYDVYHDIASYMNSAPTDNVYKQMLGKYLLVYKTMALATKPGTWVRNFIDATTKAVIDDGSSPAAVFNFANYEMKAVQDIGVYMKILKSDPELLTKANWDMIQKVFKTDMPFDDFELLRGIMDTDRFVSAEKMTIQAAAEGRRGFNIISGDDIGLRNLDETDINTAFNTYLAHESLPFNKSTFLDMYFNRIERTEEFEDIMRTLSYNMRHTNAASMFDKTINTIFKPFSATEQIVRYAQSLYLKDIGMSGNETLRRIHATQFYSAPSYGAFSKLETIMPFITFKYNNIMFWIRMMDDNPRYFRYFEDIYGTIARDHIDDALQDGQDYDFNSDYMLKNGGIPFGNGNYYFNIGSSFLSAMQDFYGITSHIGNLNPLLEQTVKYSMYALGLSSKEFFNEASLNLNPEKDIISTLPFGDFAKQTMRYFNNIQGISSQDGGPSMDVIFQTLCFQGLFGMKQYGDTDATSFYEFQEKLIEQGLWWDANLGKIVSLSERNEVGANNPDNTFKDIQMFCLVHFGKIWDANQDKFVTLDDYIPGYMNQHFDFDADEDAWNKLQEHMLKYYNKVFDYNLKKFVPQSELSLGGLNDPDISFEEKCLLMEEKFGLKWDANQQAFVTPDEFIAGGLNDTFDFDTNSNAWNEIQSLRLALFGQTYDKKNKKFNKTQEPKVVLVSDLFKGSDYEGYYHKLGIPMIQHIEGIQMHLDNEGFWRTGDGKYILMGDLEYNTKVLDKMKTLVTWEGFRYRRFPRRYYRSWRRRSYHHLNYKNKKPYKGRTVVPISFYMTYSDYNPEVRSYQYQFQFQHNYRYHNPQPGRVLNRLLSPRINYPYGGGYHKFSFYTR